METDKRQAQATAFAQGARLYYEAALSADRDIGMLPGFEIIAPYPVMTLVAHSIELSLKSSILRHKDVDPKSYGHDLVRAHKECELICNSNSIELPNIDGELLDLISGIHSNFFLRYGARPKNGHLPVFGPMSKLCVECLRLCDAPPLEDMIVQ